MMEADEVRIGGVVIGERMRPLNEAAVVLLMKSITELGLLTPITVHLRDEVVDADGGICDGVPFLVAGRHRLEAAKRLGWEDIPCLIMQGDERDFHLTEIAENLHRADLTKLERNLQTDEWMKLTQEKQAEEDAKLAQVKPVSAKGGRGIQGGVRAAVKALGIDRNDAQRAMKIGTLSDEARATAVETKLDDNQSALLAAAGEKTAEAQAAKLRELARAKAAATTAAAAARAQPKPVRLAADPIQADDSAAAIIVDNVPHDARQELVGHLEAIGAVRLIQAIRRAERALSGPRT